MLLDCWGGTNVLLSSFFNIQSVIGLLGWNSLMLCCPMFFSNTGCLFCRYDLFRFLITIHDIFYSFSLYYEVRAPTSVFPVFVNWRLSYPLTSANKAYGIFHASYNKKNFWYLSQESFVMLYKSLVLYRFEICQCHLVSLQKGWLFTTRKVRRRAIELINSNTYRIRIHLKKIKLPSGSVSHSFKSQWWNFSASNSLELFTHNYSGQLSQSSFRGRQITYSQSWGQSPFAYSQILSTVGYKFKSVVNFLDEGKFWYYYLVLFNSHGT